MCSALAPVILACHHSRPAESLMNKWARLVQIIQGNPTEGSLKPMDDAIFASDRGYNAKETIRFLCEKLKASAIGTHKRSLDFPFVFGEGNISKKHKGMVIAERGYRSTYSAHKKKNCIFRSSGSSGCITRECLRSHCGFIQYKPGVIWCVKIYACSEGKLQNQD